MTHRLVIGAGGTGRTRCLRTWVDELEQPTSVEWVTGRLVGGPGEVEVRAAVDRLGDGGILVADDLQWLGEDALGLILAAAGRVTIWASRRPWPSSTNLRALDDLLTERTGATRVGLLDLEAFGAAVAAAADGNRALSNDLVTTWHRLSGGSVAFGADLAATGWTGEGERPPEELIDAVVARVERAGPDARELVRLGSLAPGVDLDLVAEAFDDARGASTAQRAVRAAGLIGEDGALIEVVARVVSADLTGPEARELHDRLALALRVRHPERAIEHLLAGSGQVPGTAELLTEVAEDLSLRDPRRADEIVDRAVAAGLPTERFALARARSAVATGSGRALELLDAVPPAVPGDDARAALGLAIDVRDLRFDDAANRPVDSPLGKAAAALALGLAATPDAGRDAFSAAGADPDGHGQAGPVLATLGAVLDGLAVAVGGDTSGAVARFLSAADDYDRLGAVAPFGMTPHAIGALAALLGGDVGAAELLLGQAVGNDSGGEGEAVGHTLLLAYARVLAGNYHDALAAVRDGDDPEWPQRDRLLLAALDAALARRSGDTTRLREAWRRAEPVLARQTSGWVLAEPLTELLAAGARIGDRRRVDPVIEATVGALRRLDAVPGRVAAAWLELQVAIAREDADAIVAAAATMADERPQAPRPVALVEAARVWAALTAGDVDAAATRAAADALVEVGDPWEASRLLGQAALDHPDPGTARQLLEAARALTVEEVAAESGDGLAALGLSERECDVARLVSEGRTYKEIGAQLYISPKTVEHHVARIRSKLGASSRAELLSIVREATGG